MAMGTGSLIGLLALGIVILLWGGSFWWVGIGLIVISMAISFSGDDDGRVLQGIKNPAVASKGGPVAGLAQKKTWPEWDINDMKWSPTTFADGMLGVNPMETGNEGSAIGARSGTVTQDMGPIRFKDDFRFRLNPSADAEFYGMCSDPYTGKGLTAWDFRTRKDVFPGLHTGSVKTIESPDDMTNPGLGSPNDWIREALKRRQQQ